MVSLCHIIAVWQVVRPFTGLMFLVVPWILCFSSGMFSSVKLGFIALSGG